MEHQIESRQAEATPRSGVEFADVDTPAGSNRRQGSRRVGVVLIGKGRREGEIRDGDRTPYRWTEPDKRVGPCGGRQWRSYEL